MNNPLIHNFALLKKYKENNVVYKWYSITFHNLIPIKNIIINNIKPNQLYQWNIIPLTSYTKKSFPVGTFSTSPVDKINVNANKKPKIQIILIKDIDKK